ncbi:MAG: hypothetical protein U1B80_09720, partial [Anaerolineaceae bacterium]|nr:hypothetical protein [Anaerolineaceae bacterium]
MPKSRSIDKLSVDELRQLLIEKRRAERDSRLERFRRTGRVIAVEPHSEPQTMKPAPDQQFHTDDQLPHAPARSGRRKRWDRLLFLIEVAAVLGLVFVLLNGYNLLRDLNREVSSALAQP